MLSVLRKLSALFDRREKQWAVILLGLMLIAALFEVIGLGAIPAFVALLSSPDKVMSFALARNVFHALGDPEPATRVLWAAFGLVVLYVVKNSYLAAFTYLQARFIYERQIGLSNRLFRAYLYSPYAFHLERNSAQLIHNTNDQAFRVVGDIVLPALKILMELLVLSSILILLISVEPAMSLGLILLLGGSCVIFLRLVRQRVAALGIDEYNYKWQMIQWVSQGLGGIKDVKVLGRESYFLDWFGHAAGGYVKAGRYRSVALEMPRLFLETVTVLAISAVAAYLIAQHRSMQSVVTLLSLLAMAAVRLVPSANRVTSSVISLKFGLPALNEVFADVHALEIDRHITPRAPNVTTFRDTIEFDSVSFRYPTASAFALCDLSLSIHRGSAVGIVGPSGSGKTTLVDVLLGLLKPTRGQVLVDGRDIANDLPAWQQQIGYVPQFIYLLDDTIKRNIAFGLPDEAISEEALQAAIDASQLRELVHELPGGIETRIGERGIRLSGGQRQRLGIARALYHAPSILVMDEATSSLDHETEQEVVAAINRLKGSRTIITIAHRLSTVRGCDVIFELRTGHVQRHEADAFLTRVAAG